MRTKIIKRHIEQRNHQVHTRPESPTSSETPFAIEVADDEDSASFGVDKESLPLSRAIRSTKAISSSSRNYQIGNPKKSILSHQHQLRRSGGHTASRHSRSSTVEQPRSFRGTPSSSKDRAKDLSFKSSRVVKQEEEEPKMGSSGPHQYFSLRWNNYQSNMTSVFHRLLETQAFVDVTLACENHYLKAHKVVLSACSGFFQRILLDNPCKHPTIIMPSDIAFSDLQFIIDFVYRGEIDVSEAELQSLLKTAEHLKIKGLCEVSDHTDNPLEYLNYNPRHHHRIPQHQTHHRSTTSYKRQSTSSTPHKSHKKAASEATTSSSLKGDGHQLTLSDNEGEKASATDRKKMASLGMGMNGGVMGVSMGFLDFTPEPPAPTATPVTEHVDLNIAHSQDTRDLSSATPNGEVRVKFETLKSLDPAETLDIENHLSPHHQLSSHPMHIVHHPSIPQSTVLAATQHLIAVQQQNQAQDGRPHSAHSSPSQPHTPHPPAVSTPNSNDDSNHSAADVKPIIHHQIITTPTSQAQGMGGSQGNSNAGCGSDVGGDGVSSLEQHQHDSMHGMVVTPEIANMMTPSQMVKLEPKDGHVILQTYPTHTDIYNSDNSTSEDVKMETSYNDGSNKNGNGTNSAGSKVWTPEDMDAALEALKTHQMSLTKASATYGIPSTTLWQRAHRLGIDTPKKEGPTKTWNEESLNSALEALRTGTISANKASKAYGIPSSTLYKIARREGIRLAAPFNAAPTNWSAEDLERALEAIRAGQTSVQKASTEFGIPTGTLYGRCKREGIELSRSNPTPWSEDAMMEALEAVRVGHMSINQAAIHYNLPYSSLYGRFKRGRYDNGGNDGSHTEHSPDNTMQYTPPPPQMHHQQQPQHQVVTSPPPNQHLHHLQPLPHYQPTHHQQATHHQQLPSSSQVQTLNNHHTIIYHETS